MNPEELGPLFQHPASSPSSGLFDVAVIGIAVAAGAIALVGLVRGRLAPAAASAGLLLLPAFAYGLGNVLMMQRGQRVDFCASCHQPMGPVVASVYGRNDSLAALHFQSGAASSTRGCYSCHSGYGLYGNLEAKIAGVKHMLNTATGRYELPVRMRGPFDIASCLNCHAESPRFRSQEAHHDPDLQRMLMAREVGCSGACHPPAHPEDALQGVGPR